MRPRDLTIVALLLGAVWVLRQSRGLRRAVATSAAAAISPAADAAFAAADRDGDGRLGRAEFAAALGALQPTQLRPTPPVVEASISSPPPPPPPLASLDVSVPQPEQCSIVLFYHLVKTAGTTMRNVLQRQAQLGEFEYVYTDTTTKPRWWLLMHQLSHRVAPRRIIIEVHSEWGLPPSFYADVRRLRQLYEPIGCRVTLGTVLRHPVAWYFSLFAWRAANRIPLCQWSPWYDGMARQFTGHSLPFVPAAKRKMRLQPAAVSELLREFDVVGVSERFEESLLLLGARAGLRHLAHFRMGDNNKPNFPRLTRALVQAILRDAAARLPNGSVPALTDPFLPEYSSPSSPAHEVTWGTDATAAAEALNRWSMEFVERGKGKADCNFYPCGAALDRAKGEWAREHCSGDVGGGARLLADMLGTATDRQVHAAALQRLDAQLATLSAGAGSAAAVRGELTELRQRSAALEERRLDALGRAGNGKGRNWKLCGTKLCGEPLRSCVGCTQDPVPALETCWPSWEDQFTPDEQQLWCRRSWTHPGYDALERETRNYPMKLAPIPCWQTCWEPMVSNASAPHGRTPTCLERDAPNPTGVAAGPACAARHLRCSPACGAPLHAGTIQGFWNEVWVPRRPRTNLTCGGPCGNGG